MRAPLSPGEALPSGGAVALRNTQCRPVWEGVGIDLKQEKQAAAFSGDANTLTSLSLRAV